MRTLRGAITGGIIALACAGSARAQDVQGRAAALAAWDDIHAVVSHPRCTNCHVGTSGLPLWEGLGYGGALGKEVVHGMNVRADDSRIGAESMPCRTCHISAASANSVPHAPPMIADAWRLPPIEMAWKGKTSAEICVQLRDPGRNGAFTPEELSDHVGSSAFVAWGFDPGAGRVAAPGSIPEMQEALAIWVVGGTPCVGDP
ncbi:hypothetical protein GLP59_09510 [Sulfitobacter sp. M220]|jgi:hypothetical protein|uniref:hypothetical protein n=1 Tax=Sulfitobacter TaxID=60136 RepID=UPI001EEFD3E1|nr:MULTISPECIES: hypothetical protein [unclassified Sulfitobacter]MCF7726537.1 hypothetical protein [Sulfitobacter sp. M22]MCF7777879.1 hypothetical protein [Sulfitobacter sp. M220]